MVPSAAGAVVLVRFPFSDVSRSKLRPAVVLAEAGRGDWILCQITSNPYSDVRAVMLSDGSFRQGGLQRTSHPRPGKLFTANHDLMEAEVGFLKAEALRQVIDAWSTYSTVDLRYKRGGAYLCTWGEKPEHSSTRPGIRRGTGWWKTRIDAYIVLPAPVDTLR